MKQLISTSLSALLFMILICAVPALAIEDEGCERVPVSSDQAQALEDLSDDLFQIRLRNGMEFSLPRTSVEKSSFFQGLTREQQVTFFTRRKEFLTQFVRFLAFPRVIGTAQWTKGKIKSALTCFTKKRPEESENENTVENLIQLRLGENQKLGRLQKLGTDTIARMLQILDGQIWNDSEVFIKAKSRSTSFIFGLSSGAAVPGLGLFSMMGLQFDYGYNFETKTAYFKRHFVKQKLKSALLCFESMIVLGLLRQYQMDPDVKSEETTLVAMPIGFTYLSGPNTASFGTLSGVSVFELAGAGLIFLGQLEVGAAVIAVNRTLSNLSIYSTKLTRREIPKGKWKTFAMKLIKWRKPNRCDKNLSNDE